MPASTYEPLGSVTLSSAQTQVTFTNIPQIYTDLVVVHSGYSSTLFGSNFNFNGDTATNYSQTGINGNGTSATSYRDTNNTKVNAVGLFNTTGDMGANVTHIMNYSNSTTFKTVLSRMGSAGWGTRANVSLWRSTQAINSITITSSSADTYSAGSTFSLYGVGANTLKATGGDIITTDGTYWYHAFKTSGTFRPASGTSLTCDVLVVAGGGSGGNSNNIFNTAGGGGAGGVFYSASNSISSAQTVTVGAGASGASAGIQGSNSVFGSLTAAVGGGGGGNYASGSVTGGSGGSGGGGSSLGNYAGGSATSGQGFAGGNGNTSRVGAGGGGAGAVGANAVAEPNGGNGGAGVNTYSSWLTSTGLGVSGFIAGGGGGGNSPAYGTPTGGAGGSGGGGRSFATSGVAGGPGVANTGSGGGAGTGNGGSPYYGGNGGSGLVIVRYAV